MHRQKNRQIDNTLPDEQAPAKDKRGLGDWVTAVINGKTVSWQNNYAGGAAPATATSAPNTAEASITYGFNSGQATSSASATQAYSPASTAANVSSGSVNWSRQSYYNAEQGVADGLVFLNNNGGQGSGTFD